MTEASNQTPGAGRVGTLSRQVISALNLPIKNEAPIYLGETNIDHMKRRHPADYAKYGQHVRLILSDPDYVGVNPKDDSIEYVKEFQLNGEYVKVAVRVSVSGNYFVRSLYVLNTNRVNNFISKGSLKPLDKSQ